MDLFGFKQESPFVSTISGFQKLAEAETTLGLGLFAPNSKPRLRKDKMLRGF
jgi:hypothetical protein